MTKVVFEQPHLRLVRRVILKNVRGEGGWGILTPPPSFISGCQQLADHHPPSFQHHLDLLTVNFHNLGSICQHLMNSP